MDIHDEVNRVLSELEPLPAAPPGQHSGSQVILEFRSLSQDPDFVMALAGVRILIGAGDPLGAQALEAFVNFASAKAPTARRPLGGATLQTSDISWRI